MFNSQTLFLQTLARLPCDMPLQTPLHEVHPGLKSYRGTLTPLPATWLFRGRKSLLGVRHLTRSYELGYELGQDPGQLATKRKQVPTKARRPTSDYPTTHWGAAVSSENKMWLQIKVPQGAWTGT